MRSVIFISTPVSVNLIFDFFIIASVWARCAVHSAKKVTFLTVLLDLVLPKIACFLSTR